MKLTRLTSFFLTIASITFVASVVATLVFYLILKDKEEDVCKHIQNQNFPVRNVTDCGHNININDIREPNVNNSDGVIPIEEIPDTNSTVTDTFVTKDEVSELNVNKSESYIDIDEIWIPNVIETDKYLHKKVFSLQYVPKYSNFTNLCEELNLNCVEHEVYTKDHYGLKMFHIPGEVNKTVLLMHGFLDSADTFLLRKHISLGKALVDGGFNVWIGNFRGNKYSRKHKILHPDRHLRFWGFSYHEFGYYDLPAVVDYILQYTGQDKLDAISHGIGGTAFFIMGSMRPEYNKKIGKLIAMAPIVHMNKVENQIADLEAPIESVYNNKMRDEIFPNHLEAMEVFNEICLQISYIIDVCVDKDFFAIVGRNRDEIKDTFVPTILEHFPSGTSLKTLKHIAQLKHNGVFSQYDYKWMNIIDYMSLTPPEYDLSTVTMKIVVLLGRNDTISTAQDAELLKYELPNVELMVSEVDMYHMDLVWGENMKKYLFPLIIKTLTE